MNTLYNLVNYATLKTHTADAEEMKIVATVEAQLVHELEG